MDLKKARRWYENLLFPFCGCLALLMITQLMLFGYLAVVVAVAMCVIDFKFWRCPKCGRHLGRVKKRMYCHACGQELDT